MRRYVAVLAAGASATVLLAGCGDDDGRSSQASGSPVAPVSTATTTRTVTSVETLTPTVGEPLPTGALPQSRAASGDARLSVTDVRVGRHDGFDRVVFELGGRGTPGWRASFTDDPRRPGSGDPVEVPGKTVIALTILGLGYPADTGVPAYAGPNPVTGTGGITRVTLTGVFEGQADAFIGVAADRPGVRITTLSGPTRLVVDIAR
ncbi:hypothetical protein [Gordonia sp. (in: high G+C Gram-positive bacteria)]|uniref:AMIN-like domain-containing (lipo)protein n=1 Tax=Gordonia sp. (in: high G+C Gram-positive bacteria) TaxID=84139 RepID=UPI00262E140B|nr:hypothetical protein [Gordonia sp. (in: high G+C Gram-positive bacteria)]